MTTTASTLRVRDLRLMLDTSAERLADAKADAAIAPIESARMSDASANCLANAKAADASADRLADAGPTPLLRPLSVHGRRSSPS